jgi:hypothetical protein
MTKDSFAAEESVTGSPASHGSTDQFARRWGYDSDAGQFKVKLYDTAPAGRYRVEAKNDETNETATAEMTARGGDVLRVTISAEGGDGVGVTVFFEGEKVDTAWAKTAVTKCPNCGHDLP